MSDFQVVMTSRASAELEAAAVWWAKNRSGPQAARWFVEFEARIQSLAVNPQRHSLAAENAIHPLELRQLLFGISSRPTHRAIFTIIEPDIVLVLSILHVAREQFDPDEVN